MTWKQRTGASAALILSTLFAGTVAARAQSATPVPKLNLDQFTAPWYEQARLQNKREKPCVSDNVVLYSLGDKKNTFQLVISCISKTANWESFNQDGKLDPAGTGRLKLKWIWPFTHPYLVLAAAPDMQWMLVGTPNHRSLWLLSRTQTVAPEMAAEMRSRAAAEGYNVSKLVPVVQHPDVLTSTEEAEQNTDARPQAAPRSAKSAR